MRAPPFRRPAQEIAPNRTMNPNDPRDWEGIKHDYIHGNWSLARIGERYGVSPKTITAHAKKGGWRRLAGTKSLPRGRRPRPPGAPKAKRATSEELRRRDMVRRLLQALDKRLTLLEARMAPDAETGGQPPSAADAERDARTLSGLTSLYAKLIELDDAAKGGGKAEGSKNEAAAKPETSDDADLFRRDLALRLQRLNQARDA